MPILDDAYAIFCAWCDDHGWKHPTKQQFYLNLVQDFAKPTDIHGYQREIEHLRREADADDNQTS